MDVFFRRRGFPDIPFQLTSDLTVNEIKEYLAQEYSTDSSSIRLIFGGKVLGNDRPLVDILTEGFCPSGPVIHVLVTPKVEAGRSSSGSSDGSSSSQQSNPAPHFGNQYARVGDQQFAQQLAQQLAQNIAFVHAQNLAQNRNPFARRANGEYAEGQQQQDQQDQEFQQHRQPNEIRVDARRHFAFTINTSTIIQLVVLFFLFTHLSDQTNTLFAISCLATIVGVGYMLKNQRREEDERPPGTGILDEIYDITVPFLLSMHPSWAIPRRVAPPLPDLPPEEGEMQEGDANFHPPAHARDRDQRPAERPHLD